MTCRLHGCFIHAVQVEHIISWVLVGFGVMFIGISKAGFGGGMGMLTVPICAVGLNQLGKDTHFAIGFLLPLLCMGDGISLWHYRGQWRWSSVRRLVPGALAGIIAGAYLMRKFSSDGFQLLLGILAIVFVVFHLYRTRMFKEGSVPGREPGWLSGVIGVIAGITSTFAHGAGPVVAIYLIPKALPKGVFVGTNALIFSVINWMKVPFFVGIGSITAETLKWNLGLFWLVPLGVAIGVWLHSRVSEAIFRNVVLTTTFLAGIKLLMSGIGK